MINDDDDENQNPLRKFLQNMDPEKNLPANYRESPVYKRGRREGYDKGIQDAWQEANAVIDPIRSILRLHDRSFDDHFDE
jgi:hypothetical protein